MQTLVKICVWQQELALGKAEGCSLLWATSLALSSKKILSQGYGAGQCGIAAAEASKSFGRLLVCMRHEAYHQRNAALLTQLVSSKTVSLNTPRGDK
jgi:hypothetical protein